jgi:hypothetical protein
MDGPIRIPREAVDSSSIAALGYDVKRQIVAVEFKSGAIFHYAGVDQDAMLAFYTAPSKGKHYAAHIRGKFTGQKMTGPCPKCGDAEGWIGDRCEDCGCAEYQDVGRRATSAPVDLEAGTR